MKTKEFYRVLIPLLNTLLTGNRNIDSKSKKIRLSAAFIHSLPSGKKVRLNRYFLDCISTYLETLNENDRVDLSRVFLENRQLLSMAVLIQGHQSSKKHSIKEYNVKLLFILFDFLSQKNTDYTLNLTLYLYLKNLHWIKIEDQAISLDTYNKIIEDHSRIRNKEELMT